MNKPDPPGVRAHDDRDWFLEAVRFTAAETGFSPRLIEKDYFCTVLLESLAASHSTLVFKGGTCLAKVHMGFYRLSEDLDFAILMSCHATRAERRVPAGVLKKVVGGLQSQLSFFRVVEPLTAANRSTQYTVRIGYDSLLLQQQDAIKIEVRLREPLLTPVLHGAAQTVLLDPVSGQSLIPPIMLPCISKAEAFAEKFRAALSRHEVAICDFYDIDYAVRRLDLRPRDAAFVKLVQQKLVVPGNDPVNVSEHRLLMMRQQLWAQLKPVLRDQDFTEFDLERTFRTVVETAGLVS